MLCALASASALSPPRPGGRRPTAAERGAAQQIASHGRKRDWRAALAVLRSLEERANAVHYNAAIDACGKGGQWKQALSLLREMSAADLPLDSFSFSSAISAQAKAPDGWRRALALLRAMRMQGLPQSRYCHNAAVSVCGASGEWRRALQLLAAMEREGPSPDAYSFNAAIAACGRAKQWLEALALLEEAPRAGVRPDVVTYSAAMAALRNSGRWEQALAVLERMREAGVQPNAVTYHSAIAACQTGGQWVLACRLLDEMGEAGAPPDARHYAAAIAACDRGGAWEQAIKLLLKMGVRGVEPSAVAYNSAISACGRAAQWEAALTLLRRMPARSATVVTYNSAISAAARAGQWEAALELLDAMPAEGLSADAITHNAVLDALARAARWQHAAAFLSHSLRAAARPPAGARGKPRRRAVAAGASPPPDAVALCTVVAACEAAGEWRAARELLWQGGGADGGAGADASSSEGADAMASIEAALRQAPGRWAGDAAKVGAAARELRAAYAAEAATGRLGPAYTAAVRTCARGGQLRSALLLLLEAERLQGGALDGSAYAALREAAAVAGDDDLSRRVQKHIRSVVHPASRRAAAAAAAADDDDEELSAAAARASSTPLAFFVLEGAHVACENGFNASSASDVFLTRQPGGGVVGAVDAAREARSLVWQLRRTRRYTPMLSALPSHVARGRSQQWQQQLLAQHCEKKALAAQLALDYPAPSLRSTHRMCVDCHEAFRVASLAFDRAITCKDPGHLHVFEGGRCSCGGRWRGG